MGLGRQVLSHPDCSVTAEVYQRWAETKKGMPRARADAVETNDKPQATGALHRVQRRPGRGPSSRTPFRVSGRANGAGEPRSPGSLQLQTESQGDDPRPCEELCRLGSGQATATRPRENPAKGSTCERCLLLCVRSVEDVVRYSVRDDHGWRSAERARRRRRICKHQTRHTSRCKSLHL